MSQAPFAHSRSALLAEAFAANDADAALSLAVFADRPHVLAQLREDAVNAGYHVTSAQGVSALTSGDAHPLGEVIVFDCPVADAQTLAALARLDMRVCQSGAQLIVSTSMEALDAVFGCVDQSGAQLLVDAGRTDFVIALGRVRALSPNHGVRELAEADRFALMRLTEQVEAIVQRLEGFQQGGDSALRSPALAWAGASANETALVRAAQPALPHAPMVRTILRQRQQRARYFGADLFSDPAWDMLLDLTAARGENKRVSVTSLCIAACVPPSTALRWISQMITCGLFVRVEDLSDRRRAFIELTEAAADAMARFFTAIDGGPARPI